MFSEKIEGAPRPPSVPPTVPELGMKAVPVAPATPGAQLTLLVPTRNEKDNLAEFLSRVHAALAPFDLQWEVLFADDSDDETPQLIEQYRKLGYRVRVAHRPPHLRQGTISGALTYGLGFIESDCVAIIDADLQHPPELLPTLVAPVVNGEADLCLGSRYLPGGSSIGLGSLWRRIASKGSGLLVQFLFPCTRISTDPGGNFFAFRRSVVDGVELRPIGFKFITEVMVRGDWERLSEFPYQFEPRNGGVSNTSLSDGRDFLNHVLKLRATTPLGGREVSIATNTTEMVRNPPVTIDLRDQPSHPEEAGAAREASEVAGQL